MNFPKHTGEQPGGVGHAYLLLTLTALCWGGNAVFGRLAVDQVSPMLLVTLRWLGVVLLLMFFAQNTIRQDWKLLRKHWLFVSAMGALGYTAFNAFFYNAAHSTTAINIGIIQGSIPVFVILGVFAIHRGRVTRLQSLGVLITMLGVIWVASAGEFERLRTLAFNRGDFLMVVACLLYAGYAVGLRSRPDVSSFGLFAAMSAAALVASLPLTVFELASAQFQWPTATGWLVVALVVIFPSFVAQLCFMQGVQQIGPNRAGVFVNLVPIFAALLAIVILNEPFQVFHAVALLLVLGGIYLSEKGKPD